jgi:hypothetical protein
MSEATLYAIESPEVTDSVTAADFVEHSAGSKKAPTAGIASFFEHLLQVWPEDGSKGAVWYEDFTHNRPAGAVLEMTFELSEFDAKRLNQLRAIAQQHGVHVFDPEGEVLYLADGREAGS